MKIKRIEIHNYGPMKDFTLEPKDFICIFGENESGKTALVEILCYILFKKTVAALRFPKPEHVLIDVQEDGRVYTLPARKYHPTLPQADVANLLYVQASESALYREREERNFWEGMKTLFSRFGKGISYAKFDEKIFKAVGLTQRRENWTDDKENKIDAEKERFHKLEEYIKNINDVEKKENELVELTDKYQSLKEEQEQIDSYKKYQKYKELVNLHNQYQEKKMHLQEYERYKDEYLDRWRNLEAEHKVCQQAKQRVNELNKEISALENEAEQLIRKDEIIEKENIKSCVVRAAAGITPPRLFIPSMILVVAAIILILSFFLTIPKNGAIVIFIATCIYFVLTLYKKQVFEKTVTEDKILLNKAKSIFPEVMTLDEVAAKIDETKEQKGAKQTLLDEKKKQRKELMRGRSVAEINQEITDFRSKTGLAELGDLEMKINEKTALAKKRDELYGKIFGHLAERDDKKWQRMIEESKTSKPDKEPDISREKDVEQELKATRDHVERLTSKITIHRNILKGAYNIPDDRAAFIEYDRLRKQLNDYEIEKRAALTARKILKEMSSELDEYIIDIVKGNESLSEYFRIVTERYDEVEVHNKTFIVRQKDGRKFKIDELSSGAQDQLLLCFRIAALRKIYPQGAFLILDDAFIFADWARRPRLVELLKKFIDDGNQVIYLTSDDHTRDLLKEFGAKITTL